MTDNSDDERPAGREPSDIRPVSISDEMKKSYLDYAMSVIISRALPDVRDGLKPVHRRILFAMNELGLDWNKKYVKSARIVGEVMGKYHPHGNLAIYDALVRLAQDFSMRVPLVDGQGNFGSIDGDPPAAERYTESRLAKVASFLLDDLDNDTVDYRDNYDGTIQEPSVLPAKFPNLLVNGAGGIAVGMATNIPPHNLGEVIDACIADLDNPEIGIDELSQIIQGPDFPTAGLILGRGGILSAYHKGRGSIIMRARVTVEHIRKDREALVVSEIPYQVNKRTLIEKIADLVRDKKIEGISDLWDESNREGIRIVIELKRDAVADVVLNNLYKYSDLQTTFGANMLAINGGRPESLTLKDFISAFTSFRQDVVTRRIKHLLNKARDRAHVLVGLAIAVANIDEVIKLIRFSASPAEAKEQLMARDWPAKDMVPLIELIADPRHKVSATGTYRLSEEQAKAILELRLARLTALGRDEIADELNKIANEIREYLAILASRARVVDIVKGELQTIKDEFATPRKTEIVDIEGEVEDEDLIQREDCVVTVSHKGYIKRVPLATYRAQRRGGKGRSGMSTRDEDFVTQLFVTSTHTPVLFFSSRGMCYRMKVWRLPPASPQSPGKALVNLLPLAQDEVITSILPLPEDSSTWSELELIFATRSGNVRRNALADFESINRNGKIAMKLDEGDSIVQVAIAKPDQDVLLTSGNGQCVRFLISDEIRLFKGRDSTGVRGIRLGDGDEVISMAILDHFEASAEERAAYLKQASALRRSEETEDAEPVAEADAEEVSAEAVTLSPERFAVMQAGEQFVLTVSSKGFGKRSSSFEFRTSGRGGKGIVAMVVNDRNGRLLASFPIDEKDQIMLVTDGGQLIRCPVDGVRIAGRNTQGVRIFKTEAEEKVVSVERITEDETDEGSEGVSP
ncbi:DNA gyrase, A subunit [Hyphomicrobium denitrificans ATCC 51888]|uniref:DNA gyrase subunit A n=1 Tax=Hyphomicrobium denitrificans (strain ATCC 51888 / DSM 1869 / NCIMB 11706 / TK 0415) TaxID=582899 RepID=D8JQM2_HYPDA|nr:DNA gyrase subunit A [Hyphomicrobium denitrificans]ADJ23976.1 DNA gyrase, A subunit [Hyphomicrobium denitrificans ATCC 51888]